jgi:hypothetical protein
VLGLALGGHVYFEEANWVVQEEFFLYLSIHNLPAGSGGGPNHLQELLQSLEPEATPEEVHFEKIFAWLS